LYLGARISAPDDPAGPNFNLFSDMIEHRGIESREAGAGPNRKLLEEVDGKG